MFLLTQLGIISYFIPALIQYSKKLWHDVNLRLITLYWVVCGIINIAGNLPFLEWRTIEIINVSFNLIVIPMVMLLLYINTKINWLKKLIITGIGIVLILEIIGLIKGGYYYDSLKYSLGIGVMLFLIFVFCELIKFFQSVSHSRRERRMLFIYIALAFEYGTYLVIYYFEYFFPNTNSVVYEDTHILYYVSALIAMIIASIGLMLNHTRTRKYENLSYHEKLNTKKGWN